MMKNWTTWMLILAVTALGITSCSKDDDDDMNNNNNNNNNNTATAVYMVSMVVGSDTVSMEPTAGGQNPIGFTQVDASAPQDSCIHNYAGGMGWPVIVNPNTQQLMLTGESILFEMVNYFADSCSKEDALFQSLFPIGAVNFSTGNGNKGVNVWWVDDNDDIWLSNRGQQGGSSFVITKSDSVASGSTTVQRRNLQGTFNCIVYNTTGTDSLFITNGEFAFSVDDRQ